MHYINNHDNIRVGHLKYAACGIIAWLHSYLKSTTVFLPGCRKRLLNASTNRPQRLVAIKNRGWGLAAGVDATLNRFKTHTGSVCLPSLVGFFGWRKRLEQTEKKQKHDFKAGNGEDQSYPTLPRRDHLLSCRPTDARRNALTLHAD